MKKYSPYLLFCGAVITAVLLLFVIDSRTGFMLMGGLVGSLFDPSIIISGLVLGFIGRSYKHFAYVCFPLSIMISVFTVEVFVKPWLIEVYGPGGSSVETWVYLSKAFAIVLVSHTVSFTKEKFLKWKGWDYSTLLKPREEQS